MHDRTFAAHILDTLVYVFECEVFLLCILLQVEFDILIDIVNSDGLLRASWTQFHILLSTTEVCLKIVAIKHHTELSSVFDCLCSVLKLD